MLTTQSSVGLRAPPSFHGLLEAHPQDISIDEVTFRHVSGDDIDSIRHLRDELRLPTSATADPLFRRLEKKETKKALCVHSSTVTPLSAH